MKVTIVGKEVVSYTRKDTGELKEGISLYYCGSKRNVQGQCATDLWVRKDSPLYNQLIEQDFSKPVSADIVHEVQPGSRYPELTEVRILTESGK